MKFTIAMKQNWLVKHIPKSKYWIVEDSFIWYVDYKNKEWKIEVPKWFKTDFGSIPFFLRCFLNPTKYISYIAHDWCYSKLNLQYNKIESDLILLEALEVEWASFIERYFIFMWVSIFWWIVWLKKFWEKL